MSVLRAGNGQILGRPADRPSSLCDPDRFAANSRKGRIVGIVEDRVAVLNRIGQCVLEVGICIHAYELASVDDSIVATIDPGGPGV